MFCLKIISTISSQRMCARSPNYFQWMSLHDGINRINWSLLGCSAPILAQVMNAETWQQLWQHLQRSHTSQSVVNVLEFKVTLQTSKKDSSSCAQLVQHIVSYWSAQKYFRLRSGTLYSLGNLSIFFLRKRWGSCALKFL
jgi:hypothetical protein